MRKWKCIAAITMLSMAVSGMTGCQNGQAAEETKGSIVRTEAEKEKEETKEKNKGTSEMNEGLSSTESEETHWKTDYARLVGQQALIYGYPAAKFGSLALGYNEKAKAAGLEGTVNTYMHSPKLLGPEFKGGTSMNRDTLYSIGWADLTDNPMVFTIGENIDGRYYSIEFIDWYSDCIGYMGSRTTHDVAAAYLIHAPGWSGDVPAGITKVIESPTNWILAVGRTFTTNDDEDLKVAHQLQEDYKMYPISEWGKAEPKEAEPKGELPDAYVEGDVLGYFDFMNMWIKKAGYPQRDEEAMKNFALAGLGGHAEGSVKDLDEMVIKGLELAYVDGMKLLEKTSFAVGSILDLNKTVNGWTYNPQNWGRMAETGDFLGRSATQAYSGGTENLVEEAVKLRTFTDQNGDNLNGSNQYELRFTADQIPKVDAFWSVTAYDNTYNIAANAAEKYEIRDIDKDLKYGEDGSLTIRLQSEEPEEDVNWLPVADGVDFNLFFRAYLPGEDFINQEYAPPAIQKLDF